MTYLYFVERCYNGEIKVGYTKDFKKRLRELRSQWGELRVLGVTEGGRAEEKEVHRKFAKYRLGYSDFFTPNDELIEFINQCEHITFDRLASGPKRYNRRKDYTETLTIYVSPEMKQTLEERALEMGKTPEWLLHYLIDPYIKPRK